MPPRTFSLPSVGGLAPGCRDTVGGMQPRVARGDHGGTGAQSELCAGVAVSQGFHSGGIPGDFLAEPFQSGKEAGMAAG